MNEGVKVIKTPTGSRVFVDKIIVLFVEENQMADGSWKYFITAQVGNSHFIRLAQYKTGIQAEKFLDEIMRAIYEGNMFCYVMNREEAILE